MFFDDSYITLDSLATRLGLPQPFLKHLANAGKIPFLDVNGRKRFLEKSVRDALSTVEKRSLNVGGG